MNAPSTFHQTVTLNISVAIANFLKGKPCKPFVSPVDVYFSNDTVVQPDIIIVCDKTKIKTNGIEGAPDVIFEVISPATGLKDKRIKKKLYEESGVKEFFIVSPFDLVVEKFILKDGKYSTAEIINWDEKLKIDSIELEIELKEVFEKEKEIS
jgi:Uma2 family endonuclease